MTIRDLFVTLFWVVAIAVLGVIAVVWTLRSAHDAAVSRFAKGEVIGGIAVAALIVLCLVWPIIYGKFVTPPRK